MKLQTFITLVWMLIYYNLFVFRVNALYKCLSNTIFIIFLYKSKLTENDKLPIRESSL